jgi:methanogenic corrinoid protein MtbC1
LGEDEDGKQILSVSAQKDDVIKAMENVIEKSTDEGRRGRFEKALLHYNMGGAAIPQDIAQELFAKENIRLVR